MTSPNTLLKAWGLHPKKGLGQNFLSDPSVADRIVKHAGLLSEDIVLEIGSGLGSITIPAAKTARKVYAVEKDREIAALLKTELIANRLSNVIVLEEDILKLNIKTIGETARSKLVVLGNLPYNISSQVLVQLIEARNCIDRAILMFQKELAQRLTAYPGGKDYGRLSVMLQYCSEQKMVMDVGAAAFTPRPRIDSKVVEICFKERLLFPCENEPFFFKVIKGAFGKRRKMLKNALANSALCLNEAIILNALARVGIDPKRRAETLSVEEFVHLSNGLLEIAAVKNI